jgi:hypothetical protein
MPKVGRKLYDEATKRILEEIKYKYQNLGLGKILINKNGRTLYIEVAGKNLPYFGSSGKEAFSWETHIQPDRLDKIELKAKEYGAESWIVFCYAILKDEYKHHFSTIVTLDGTDFGAKLIKTNNYRNYMKPRSASWSVVDLPRKKVTQITCDPEDI